MTERQPAVGEYVLTIAEDGETIELQIDTVGDYVPDDEQWVVHAEGEKMKVYWSPGDNMWVDSEAVWGEQTG